MWDEGIWQILSNVNINWCYHTPQWILRPSEGEKWRPPPPPPLFLKVTFQPAFLLKIFLWFMLLLFCISLCQLDLEFMRGFFFFFFIVSKSIGDEVKTPPPPPAPPLFSKSYFWERGFCYFFIHFFFFAFCHKGLNFWEYGIEQDPSYICLLWERYKNWTTFPGLSSRYESRGPGEVSFGLHAITLCLKCPWLS